jgi:pilus assembly protein CpaB
MTFSRFRLRNLALAAVLAVAAMAATLLYVSRSRAHAESAPATATASVLVATRDIPIGTTAAQIVHGGWVRVTSLPQGDAVPDSVSAASALAGLVATQTTYAGEQLTAHRFGNANQQGIRSGLTGALRVVALPGDPYQLLAGTLRNGDHVDVVASIARPEGGAIHYSRVVLRNILVVDAPAAGSSGAQQTVSAQLQLSDEQAQRLFWVEQNAKWELALRPGEKATSTPAPAASADSILRSGNGS